ncbi:MAG: outer membrane protein assembly factor BamD [Ignavibacteriae bacterium]|nr:outer membrane protein assembly factor BamD [Ignavibacteriota bacterium]
MKKNFVLFIVSIFIWNCSSSVDTTSLTSEQHLEYARKLFLEEDYEEAIREFQSILLQYTGSQINDDAQYFLAFSYFKREQYLLSAYEFSKVIRDTPASEFVQDAQFMLAESYFQLSPHYQLEQSYSKKAIEEFQAFIEFFPTHPKVEEAEKKIAELYAKFAEKEYHSAMIYEKMEYFNAAIQYYENVKNTYFDSEFAPLAHYKLINLLILKNRKDEALRNIADYISKYPNDDNIDELKELNKELENSVNG